MHTIIHPFKSNARRSTSVPAHKMFRTPYYDCVQTADALKVIVYVPGVEARGVEITVRGPDLIVTARKTHIVRVNWQALHLEGAQRDYQLRLRLGSGIDYDALHAEIADGVLTVTLPKKSALAASNRRVA